MLLSLRDQPDPTSTILHCFALTLWQQKTAALHGTMR